VSQSQTRREGRPPGFLYRTERRGIFRRRTGAYLYCDSIAITKLVEKFGTPLYVYSATTIKQRQRAFARAFEKFPHTVCYSVKANSNLSILKLLSRLGCGFDVVSGGELERVLTLDRRAARRVVFSGVGKSPEEMQAALKAGILLFNVESESEMWCLAEVSARLRKTARIALRVNPDVSAKTHAYISTGLHQHKFGVPIGEARALYASASALTQLRVAGVSVHIGSQITDVQPFAETMERVANLVRRLRADGHKIEYVDAGGGLGIPYEDGDQIRSFEEQVRDYAEALTRKLRGLDVHLLLEPGRAIMGPAGALITRVAYVKKNNSKQFAITDAAMNDFLRPSLYDAYHEIVPVRRAQDAHAGTYDVVGPICESGDFFAHGRTMSEISEGELLAILDTGAYGMVLASNYNTRPRAAEVMVDGNSVKVIRRRETVADLLRQELV
jgi:diaminopimelate decarboxylase